MGISNDAILCFGIDVGEGSPFVPRIQEDDPDNYRSKGDEDYDHPDYDKLSEIGGELDKFLVWKAGLQDPYDNFPEEGYPEEDWKSSLTYEQRRAKYERDKEAWEKANPDWIKARDEYSEAKDRLEKECPIRIVSHCSYDYPMYVIAVRGDDNEKSYRDEFYRSASRGYPEAIADASGQLPPIPQEKIEAAQEFCREHGLPAFDEPKWLICTMNG